MISFYLKVIVGCGFLFVCLFFFEEFLSNNIHSMHNINIILYTDIIFSGSESVFYDVVSYFAINCISIAIIVSLLKEEEFYY